MKHSGSVKYSPAELAARLGLPTPTPEQEAVISAPLEPQVVVAGAGSGKTETMAARVVWLVANDLVAPEGVLGLTFTRKAAGELSERVLRRLRGLRAAKVIDDDLLSDSPTISTYHAYASSLVRDHGLLVGVEPSTRLLSEASAWQLVHDLVERWDTERETVFDASIEVGRRFVGEDLAVIEKAVDTLVQAVLALSGQVAEHLIDLNQLDEELADAKLIVDSLGLAASHEVAKALAFVRGRRVLIPVLQAYRRRKRDLELMDFGDQVEVAARLASLGEVATGQRRQFQTVLLDEFQDTSFAQLELLARLFGGGHPVTAVGDPNQSIYGWRGASAGNLDAFRERFRAGRKQVAVLGLTTSWRNPKLTLKVANAVAAPLRAHSGVSVSELKPAPNAGDGQVTLGWHETILTEADWLAEQIAARWRPGGDQTAAVVCRQRSQFAAIEAALTARGIPVEVIGLGGLLQRPEVADIVATLTVLVDPTRSDALVRLLTGPRWQLGPRDLVALGSWARELAGPVEPGANRAPDPESIETASLIDAIHQLPPPDWEARSGHSLSTVARDRLTRLARELTHLARLTTLPLVDLVAEVERQLLLDVELAVHRPGARAGREQLDQFAAVAADFADATGRPSLSAFVSWLQAASERERGLEQAEDDPIEEPRDGVAENVETSTAAVQLLTVHAAKGLEWNLVAVPGLVERRFPSIGSRQGRDSATGWFGSMSEVPYPLRGDAAALPVLDLAQASDSSSAKEIYSEFRYDCGAHEAREERRLAYVAVTRARSELLLSGYRWDETTRPREPSRFLRQAYALAEQDPRFAVDSPITEVAEDAENPLKLAPVSFEWPVPNPLRPALQAAGEQVRTATGEVALSPELSDLAETIDRLLEERALNRLPDTDVQVPVHLSASRAVQLASDPAAFALQLRRPMPTEPNASVRRGTAFHEWIERRLHSQSLLDLADLVGAGDDELLVHDDDLERFKTTFESSIWAQREVLDTEVDIETVVAGVSFRGRIDAVFAAPNSSRPVLFDIVDWKTGARPRGDSARAATVQLAVYRVAFARLRGVPVEQVRASFFYLASGETISPAQGVDEGRLAELIGALR